MHFYFFEVYPYCFPQWLHQSAFPPTVQKSSSFSTPSLALIYLQLSKSGINPDVLQQINGLKSFDTSITSKTTQQQKKQNLVPSHLEWISRELCWVKKSNLNMNIIFFNSFYCILFLISILFIYFYFSITGDIQYYFILVSVHCIVVRQLYNLQSDPSNNSRTHITPYIVITILLTIFPMTYFTPSWLFCN